MKKEWLKKSCYLSLIGLIIAIGCAHLDTTESILQYGTGSWEPDTLGNHRIVLYTAGNEDAVRAEITWRRRDKEPGKKMMILINASTGEQVQNLVRFKINREYAKIVFQPQGGAGEYYLYYLPYSIQGRNYPKVNYPEHTDRADQSWISRNELMEGQLTKDAWEKLPEAKVVEIQSIDEFNSFYPMEVIATKSETDELLTKFPDSPYLLFPECREYPIRMKEDLPFRWIKKGPAEEYYGKPDLNEYFAFQIGLFAARTTIEDVDFYFSDLAGKSGKATIPADAITCFNKEGTNWNGQSLSKEIRVDKRKIQALWFGVDIPPDISPGRYTGFVTVTPKELPEKKVKLVLDVQKDVLADRGDGEPWRHSRLRWLNSQLAADHEVVDPFEPLNLDDHTITCLGRMIILDDMGLPEKYLTYFTPGVTGLKNEGEEVISNPIRFNIKDNNGRNQPWELMDFTFLRTVPGLISWQSDNKAGNIRMVCNGTMEFDGFMNFNIILTAEEDIDLNDITLEIPVNKEFASYMMGLGLKGGKRPPGHEWSWDSKKNQEGAWIGNVHGGLQFGLRGANYSRPLNTNFYLSKPLNMPDSWFNEGKGGISIREEGNKTVRIKAYSGSRILQKGEELHYTFYLLLTPFKPLNTNLQWSARFYHRYNPVDTILAAGATVVNVHHANEVNPYINYPFIHQNEMKTYIKEAHEKGLKVKIYNTIRELSNRAPEIFAIRSLGHEIFSSGPGNGYSWLQEHLVDDYIAAWFVPHFKDAAIINSGMSRWHNYYIEGLDWLTRNMEIDGLYIDDIAFDRTTMKRVRKVLDRNRDGALIDLHSANQYNVRDGYINSASLYMEHFPYIDRLWFGEYFDKESPPDFWLVEMSGIPFGLMGEMLQDGGNKYRGLVYGMTSRLPWAGDPRGIWKAWDEFGIGESEMIGYWTPGCPVTTDCPDILATAYVREGECLVAIGSWASETENISLAIDWNRLGINVENVRIEAPFIDGFQENQSFQPDALVPVEAGKGWLLKIYEYND